MPSHPASLVRRLTAGLTLIVGVSTLVVVGLFSQAVHRAEDAEVRRNIVSAGGIAARLVATALAEHDRARAIEVAGAITLDKRIAELTLDDSVGPIAHIQSFAATDTLSHATHITYRGRVVGHMRLVFSRALYTARAERQTREAAMLGAAVLIIALIGLHVLLGRLLQRPLDALTSIATQYTDGNYDCSAAPMAYSEFEPVREVLTRMATRIREQLREMRRANRRLAAEVTVREEAEKRALESRNMLALVIDAVPQSVFWKDRRSVYMGANAVFARWTGLESSQAVVGRTDDELPCPGGDPAAYRALDREVVDLGVVHREIVQEVQWANGQTRWVETTKIPLVDEAGAVIGLLGVSDDITDRRAAAERTERVRHAQKLEALGQLAGGVAHDFNNIVTAIQLQLELMETEHALTPAARDLVHDVRASADRAAGVARQLLLFGRRQAMTLARTDLDTIVAPLLRMLARVIGSHVRMQYARSATALPIDADVGMIEQVVTNLCLNARDAMPNGGDLTIRTGCVDIEAGAFAFLEVSDTGCGMSPETLRRVFEPFFTTKDVGEGTGLGLATSHSIVQQHRGWFEASSRIGEGTTFRVHLPLASDRMSHARPSGAIIVVGNGGPAAHTAARALRRLGREVIEVPTVGEAAQEIATRGRDVRLALVDSTSAGVPNVDALSAARVRVVVMTDVASPTRRGAHPPSVLLKPFTLADLYRTVDAGLD